MQSSLWSLYGMFTFIVLAGVFGYGVIVFATNPHVKEISAISAIRTALRNIGVEKPAWRTLIISATQDIKLPIDKLWETFSSLETWSEWGGDMVASSRWVGGEGWAVGARFEQAVYLGIPAGLRRSTETVEEYVPMQRVRWCRTSAGVRSCHIWSFTMLPNGRTRVTNTEVFDGTPIGVFKPILAAQWQRRFDQAVKGLAEKTHESLQA